MHSGPQTGQFVCVETVVICLLVVVVGGVVGGDFVVMVMIN